MRIAGIILFLLGGLAFLVGVVICVVTLRDDYARSACEKAARDAVKFEEASARCGPTTSDCYKRATEGLTSKYDCESRTSFMNRQLLMGVVPTVVGGLLGFVGFLLTLFGFIRARRKRATLA